MAVLNYLDPNTQQWVPLEGSPGPMGPIGPIGPTGAIGPTGPGLSQSTADGLYVNVIGDTMTGGLAITGGWGNGLTVNGVPLNADSTSLRLGLNAAPTGDITGSIAIGPMALNAVYTGKDNVAIGTNALDSITSSGDTVAIGHNAGRGITSANNSTFVGAYSGDGIDTAYQYTCIGYGASAADGMSGATAIGQWAKADDFGTAVGAYTQAGAGSVVVGNSQQPRSEYSVSILGDADLNGVAIGVSSGTYGASGVAIGDRANVYGNVANGTALGRNADVSHANSTALGYNAATTAANQIMLGTATNTVSVPGKMTLAADPGTALEAATKQYVDNKSGLTQATADTLYVNVIGDTMTGGLAITGGTGWGNGLMVNGVPFNMSGRSIRLGPQAALVPDFVTGVDNIAIGSQALKNATVSGQNVAIGTDALLGVISNSGNNTAVGYQAGKDNADRSNVFVGAYSGIGLVRGYGNVAIGNSSVLVDYSEQSVVIGYQAETNYNGVAIGGTAKSGVNGVSIGPFVQSTADSAVSINGQGTGTTSTAVGSGSRAAGGSGTALGETSTANGLYSTAVGSNANAAQQGATAIGFQATTTAIDQIMLGTATNTVQVPGAATFAKPVVLTDPVPTAANHAASKQYVDGKSITRSVTVTASAVTAGSTAGTDYYYICTSPSARTVTLPTAVGNTNMYTIKRTGQGLVTIATTASQTIDGATTLTVDAVYMSINVLSDGSNWVAI